MGPPAPFYVLRQGNLSGPFPPPAPTRDARARDCRRFWWSDEEQLHTRERTSTATRRFRQGRRAARGLETYAIAAKAIEPLSDSRFADLGLKKREDLQRIPRDWVDVVAPGAV